MTISSCILAIDTATGPSSVAVWREGRVAAYCEDTRLPSMQSARLLPMVEEALAQSGIGYGDLSAVACTVGPGSFTGIRVALAAARGIAFAAQLPQLGFTTLEILAFAANKERNKKILAILNAGKGEYYYQPYAADGLPLCEVRLGSLEAAIIDAGQGAVTVAGNVPVAMEGFTASPVTFPRADALAALAAMRANTAMALKPFYIRAPDAKLPSKAT